MKDLKQYLIELTQEKNNEEDYKEAVNSLAFRMIQDMMPKQFGDCMEDLLKAAFELQERKHKLHDATYEEARVEIKVSTATYTDETKKPKNETLANKLLRTSLRGYGKSEKVAHSNMGDKNYSVCMKQVKPNQFEYLLFGICYVDCVALYVIPTNEVGNIKNYSNKGHYGNTGEGQVDFNRDAVANELAAFKAGTVSYYSLFKNSLSKEELDNLLREYTEQVGKCLQRDAELFNEVREQL